MFRDWRLGSEEEIVAHHGPDAGNIFRGEEDGAVMPAKELIGQVDDAAGCEEPHEGEMPLKSSAEPASQGEGFRYINQVVLGDLGAETWEGPEDAQSAGDEDEDADGVHPMGQADRVGMLVGGANLSGNFIGGSGWPNEHGGSRIGFHGLLRFPSGS